MGGGVSACAVAMVFYRNQEVVIVGAGVQLVRKHITYLSFVKCNGARKH
jgi:thioredoxin reductase